MRILRGTGSRILPCGCLIGLYQTYEGRPIAMVDAPDPKCGDRRHRTHAVVDLSNALPSDTRASLEKTTASPEKPRR